MNWGDFNFAASGVWIFVVGLVVVAVVAFFVTRSMTRFRGQGHRRRRPNDDV